MEFSEIAPLLHAIAMAEASDAPLDVTSTAADLEITQVVLREHVEQIEGLGLALSGLEEGLHAILLTAGRQYLALAGEVDVAVLSFSQALSTTSTLGGLCSTQELFWSMSSAPPS